MFRLPKFVKKYNEENHKSVYHNPNTVPTVTPLEQKVMQNSENILSITLLLGDLINELLDVVLKDNNQAAAKLIKNLLNKGDE